MLVFMDGEICLSIYLSANLEWVGLAWLGLGSPLRWNSMRAWQSMTFQICDCVAFLPLVSC